jgi:hypothetical protein
MAPALEQLARGSSLAPAQSLLSVRALAQEPLLQLAALLAQVQGPVQA